MALFRCRAVTSLSQSHRAKARAASFRSVKIPQMWSAPFLRCHVPLRAECGAPSAEGLRPAARVPGPSVTRAML